MKKKALISVYDKSGIVEFSKKLINHGFEIISTSGTARLLKENEIELSTIEDLTGSHEILEGRVKTLHPIVFAGILADKKNPGHLKELEGLNIGLIDLVVVNLYPFKETVSADECTVEEAIEQIDIGGVSLIRAAAKNFNSISVITSSEQYNKYLESLDNPTYDLNLELATEAFRYIADYDIEIFRYFNNLKNSDSTPQLFDFSYQKNEQLRYGENPHQDAYIYYDSENSFNDIFAKLHGKELSYNNLLDINAAYDIILEFEEPACAIIKHTNPCGVACDPVLSKAFEKALSTDNVSAFGGIIIFNGTVDLDTASEADKIFSEIIIARDFTDEALKMLKKKKNRRLLKYLDKGQIKKIDIRSITGGLLVQNSDNILLDTNSLNVVTRRKPDDSEMNDMIFAMKIAKHTKSNAVIYASSGRTLGIGGGQPSRVDSSMLAVRKAKQFNLDLKGSAVASDAFFPFADGIIEAAKAGARSVIQPGGSVRDEEVIKAADENDIAMVFTGIRHFKH